MFHLTLSVSGRYVRDVKVKVADAQVKLRRDGKALVAVPARFGVQPAPVPH